MKLFSYFKNIFCRKQNNEYILYNGERYKININSKGKKYIMAISKKGNKYYKYI